MTTVTLTGDPVTDINRIGQTLGIPRPPWPAPVQPIARRTEGDRARMRGALDFIRGDISAAPVFDPGAYWRSVFDGEVLADYDRVAGLLEQHEAGHALTAARLGYKVDRVALGRDSRHGETRLAGPTRGPEDTATILLAGLAAERLHHRWESRYGDLWDGSEDGERLHQLAASVSLPEMADRAERILADNHRELAALTTALQVHSTLAGAELDRLLSRAGRRVRR